MTSKERDMLQFAVWLLYMRTEELPKTKQYGYSRSDWIELWNKILERRL